ncbi:MAG: hypothetical protein KDH94_06610 [Coxiellaceae bacterium]|nr:hypothetical protein [Coxiellaceae bacterium]
MRQGFRTFFCSLTPALLVVVWNSALANATSIHHTKKPQEFTEVRLLTPYTAEGLNHNIKITKTLHGECWTTSQSDQSRPNTWRCQAEQKIYDPCFVNPVRHNNQVICITDPWNNNAVELTLDNALPSNQAARFNHQSAQPWALELANGNHCTLITGPSLHVAGMATAYQCKSAVLVGKIDKNHEQWTIFYLENNSLFMKQMPILAAWY